MSEEYDSPYCEVCGTCGYIGCCGIRNFIEEHIKGKTNCKNEDLIISELIWLCENEEEKDKEIERLNNIITEYVKDMENYLESNPIVDIQDYTHRVDDIYYMEKDTEGMYFITTIKSKLKELKENSK